MRRSSLSLNIIITALITLIIMVVVGVVGDYYFDLNDDVLMKDILSGSYTGVPAGHNIQMLYPISALISVFYRVFRAPDWYGIFLCFLQFLCVFAVAYHVIVDVSEKANKIVWSVMVILLFLGTMASHFLFVQYTFTCGMLSATATFLIMTHKEKDNNLIFAVILVFVAYLLRSEMLLLTLPMLCVGILIRWALTGKEFKNYLKAFILIICALILGQVANKIGYSSPEWKEFYRLFDARTELYDFQYIPEYADNKDFYDSIGLSESEQELLVNYNFGIDEEINADTLNAVAQYAAKLRTDEVPMTKQLLNAISPYLYRMRFISGQKSYEYPMTDFPWNMIVLLLYLGAILTALFPVAERNKKNILLTLGLLALLFACRSSLWLYIIVRGRDPIRITHPLYLMEIVILLAIIHMKDRNGKRVVFVPLVAVSLISLLSIPNQFDIIKTEMASRDSMRQHYDALYDYFDANKDNFYFIDVYTSVSCGENKADGEATFSEKMFERVDNSYANHDIMGGWASKSPLFEEKMQKFGLTNMQDSLLLDNVYMVQVLSEDVTWIADYYREKGIDVTVKEVDKVADAFGIYSISVR